MEQSQRLRYFWDLFFNSIVAKKVSPKRRRSSPCEEVIVDESIHPLMGPRPCSPTPGSASYSPSSSRSPGGRKVGSTKGYVSPTHVSPPRSLGLQSGHDVLDCDRQTDVGSSPFSNSKPPRLRRAQSAGLFGRHPDSGYHANDDDTSEVKSTPWSGLGRPKSATTSSSSSSLSNGHHIPSENQNETFHETRSPGDIPSSLSQVSRDHDEETLSVLGITFPLATTPTLGLPRAVLPPESEQKRYYSLIEGSISSNMVAPLSKEWKKKTHEFLAKSLRQEFKETLDEIDKVRNSFSQYIIASPLPSLLFSLFHSSVLFCSAFSSAVLCSPLFSVLPFSLLLIYSLLCCTLVFVVSIFSFHVLPCIFFRKWRRSTH